MNTKKEIRVASIDDFSIERRDDGTEGLIIEGYAAVYDTVADIGGYFEETIARGAFDDADLRDVPLKYNHTDNVPILARTRNKSLIVTPDEKGLHVRAELLDTQDGIDMYKRIKAGLIDKMSFAFTIPEDGDTWEKKDGKRIRTINKFDRIFDVSVVDTPAYEDTSIFARSKEIADAMDKPTDDGATRSKQTVSTQTQTILLIHKGAKV